MTMQGLNYYSKDEIDEFIEAGTTLDGFTAERREKLDGIEAGAEVNDINAIKVNGTAQTISNKAVDITMPTKTSDITNDSGYVTSRTYYGIGSLADDPDASTQYITYKMVVVECANFVLQPGVIVVVKMQEDAPVLGSQKMNVNNTGRKSYHIPITTAMWAWKANDQLVFVYDGTDFYEISRYGIANTEKYGMTILTDAANPIAASNSVAASQVAVKAAYTLADSKATVLDCYPVGSYYETSDASFNPNTTWGGTWQSVSTGRWHRTA